MRIRSMARCALFSALLALCAWLAIPMGDGSFTMQTFGVFLTLGILGGKQGCAAILVYLLLGCAGLPVFSGFRGGIGALMGPTGGYLVGFLATGGCYWAVTALWGNTPRCRLAAMATGSLVCYIFGSVWYYFLYSGNAVSLGYIIIRCVLPYLIPDGIKLALAWSLSNRLRRFI